MSSLHRKHAWVVVAFMAAALPFGPHALTSVAIGAGIQVLNLWVLERTVARMLGIARSGAPPAVHMLLHMRLALLFAVLAAVLLSGRVELVPFSLGISSVVPAVLWHGLQAREV